MMRSRLCRRISTSSLVHYIRNTCSPQPKLFSTVLQLQRGKEVWCASNRAAPRQQKNFTSLSPSAYSAHVREEQRTGLFDNPELSTGDFDAATKKCLEKSRILVQQISQMASDINPDIAVVNKMDELSDTLCRVADLAECIRQIHPDPPVASKAQDACLAINNYVEQLNTNTALHRALKKLTDSTSFEKLDEVTRRTADSFMHDFEISGIHLAKSLREEVVQLTNDILELGYMFSQNASLPATILKRDCPSHFLKHLSTSKRDGDCVQVDHVPSLHPDPEFRKCCYLLYNGAEPEKVEVFQALVLFRQKLANLVGYPSYAHRVLKTSMAGQPEVVMKFLNQLSNKIAPLVKQDLEMMLHMKISEASDEFDKSDSLLKPWDVPLLISKARQLHLPQNSTSALSQWFSLDACLGGLDNLFQSLFGVRLEVSPVKPGETWDLLVQKLAFVHETEGLLGYTYMDLHSRPSKLVSDCHFTIQGGREVSLLDKGSINESRLLQPTNSNSFYQIPIITICCSFVQPSPSSVTSSGEQLLPVTLLSRHSVETLFHEMGHALHSMLGRAKYQNVTGTRCPTDFAEVPSILMEFFLADGRVLSSFARHYKTGEALPETHTKSFQLWDQCFVAYETQVQIMNAIMDQKFHTLSKENFIKYRGLETWSINLYEDTYSNYSPLEYVPSTANYLRFNHLVSYGGKYYSYLWSRAVASLIWNSCFNSDPFSRESGERYREMLNHGGGVHPWTLVKDVLGFEPSVDDLVDTLYKDVLLQRERVGTLTPP